MRMLRLLLLLTLSIAAVTAADTLDIYFVDVEGGQATLIVTPAGESMLVDAGWPGFEGRDAKRIAGTAKAAGLRKIDYVLTTHYHTDHVGGVPPLVEHIPVVHFVDHGPNTETSPAASELAALYYKVRDQGKHIVVKAGDQIPLKGAEVRAVSARGALIDKPLPGGGDSNSLCASAERRKNDPSENARSVGVVLDFGDFRFVDLGDMTWNVELDLACPVNRVGPVDVYLTTHHGMDMSGPAALVQAMRPRVAIMNNGAKKGGSPAAWQIIKNSPGLEAFWQLHYAVAGGQANNVDEKYIANVSDQECGKGIVLSARKDGSFTVTNERNGHKESYKAR